MDRPSGLPRGSVRRAPVAGARATSRRNGLCRGVHAMTVEFFVAGVAQPKGSARAFIPKGWQRAVITSGNPRLKEWQTLVSLEAARHVNQGVFGGPVVVELLF